MATHAVYFMCGINAQTAQDFRHSCLDAILNGKATELLIHMSSTGGSLHEGFGLYHFLKSLPVKVTVSNVGSVESSAVIMYLGGHVRVVAPAGRFVFHPWSWDFGSGSIYVPKINESVHSLEVDRDRYKEILDGETKGAKTPFDLKSSFDVAKIIDAKTSIEHGIAQDMKDLPTPPNSVLWWVNNKS